MEESVSAAVWRGQAEGCFGGGGVVEEGADVVEVVGVDCGEQTECFF